MSTWFLGVFHAHRGACLYTARCVRRTREAAQRQVDEWLEQWDSETESLASEIQERNRRRKIAKVYDGSIEIGLEECSFNGECFDNFAQAYEAREQFEVWTEAWAVQPGRAWTRGGSVHRLWKGMYRRAGEGGA